MKLNINAKELLALHNLLYEKFEGSHDEGYPRLFKEGDERAGPDAQLRQVYSRLKACIVNSLTGKAVDPFDAWAEREQQKLDKLNEELDDVKKSSVDLVKKTAEDPDYFVPAVDENWDMSEYPKRSARPAGGRQGKHHNKR
jgi:hypothetical protein